MEGAAAFGMDAALQVRHGRPAVEVDALYRRVGVRCDLEHSARLP